MCSACNTQRSFEINVGQPVTARVPLTCMSQTLNTSLSERTSAAGCVWAHNGGGVNGGAIQQMMKIKGDDDGCKKWEG